MIKYKTGAAKLCGFWPFTQARRESADLYLYFDDFGGKSASELAQAAGAKPKLPVRRLYFEDYKVSKMRFVCRQDGLDRSVIVCNERITLRNIPLAACDYAVKGK